MTTAQWAKTGIGVILLAAWMLLIYFPRDNSDKLISFIQNTLVGLSVDMLSNPS
jgi:hypothetical protein